MKRLLILPILAVLLPLSGQELSPVTISDISGDGSVHAIAASGTARTITFFALPGNSTTNCGSSAVTGCIRIGDANISTSRGTIMVPGAGAYLGESPGTQRYTLSSWYYLVQSGDKITIAYTK